MAIHEIFIIVVAGVAAGFFNTVAGGGSLITLPVLIFLGLPPNAANATNRVAILNQNAAAVAGFKSKGVSVFPYALWLGISALLGSIIGAMLAVDINPDSFKKILAIIMILVVVATVFRASKKGASAENMSTKRQVISIVVFFFIGIYGGFIQAGVGFLIIAALTNINGFGLVKANAAKVLIVFTYTLSALVVFIVEDQIFWIHGLILAASNATGAWVASRWSVQKGDKVVSRILIIMVIALAIKLWFFE